MKYLILSLFFIGCSPTSSLKTGDIVFVEAKKENLSGAISRVTSEREISFDHVGLIKTNKRKKYLLHAAPENGSEQVLLEDFLNKNRKNKRVQVVYRLKKEYRSCIPKALEKASSLLGKPYNFSYVLNDKELYCSDFIQRAFISCNIFELKPMTFINPETKKTDEFWLNFYQKLNIPVPEGKPGCNPNGLSVSEKLKKIKTIYPQR